MIRSIFAIALISARFAVAAPLTADDCVRIAIEKSGKVKASRADAEGVRAQADQVASMLSPQVQGTAFAAPLFGAKGGIGWEESYSNDIGSWGPYLHADARLVVPLSTFGRYTDGVRASQEKLAVEEEKTREVANTVRLEVRRLYGLRLYALSMQPSLRNASELLHGAIEKAQELYDEGGGEITLPELMKLKYGELEINRFLRLAIDGSDLATRGLKQAMGLMPNEEAEFAEDRLSVPTVEVPALEVLVEKAKQERPEMAQIAHGRNATIAWESAEAKALYPVLFAAAIGQIDWTPEYLRPKGYSASGFNTFNDYSFGVALGLRFDGTIGLGAAKAAEAHAKQGWVEANAHFAETGIPVQVFKARQELVQAIDLAKVADEQVTVTKKWMAFAAAAYGSGTGEAKDVLEGVAANLGAKKNFYDSALAARQAQAELELAIGARQ